MKGSLFEACCNTQTATDTVRQQSTVGSTQQGAVQTAATRTGNMENQNTMQKAAQPVADLLTRVEERVPMVAPLTAPVRTAIQGTSANAPENDRLGSNVITGRGEDKQTFQDAIEKHDMPSVGIFPANSKTGLSTLRALTGYPNRNTCAKIQCIVREETDIRDVRSELNEHLTDSIAFAFADYNDEHSLVTSFIGLDRLLLIAPNAQNRANLVCRGIRAARLAGVPHVILMSAMSALQPTTQFGKEFRIMEECLESCRPNINFTHMRMAWFMDNFLDMSSDIISNNRFVSSWGPSAVSAVAIADVGRCAAGVLAAPKSETFHHGRIYHLTGPESLSGFRMAEIFSKVLGRQITYQDLPRDEMRRVYMEQYRVPEWEANGFTEMNEHIKSGAAAAYSTDVALLTKGNHTTLERYIRNKRWFFAGQRSPLMCILPASGRIGTNTLNALMQDRSQARIRAVVRSQAHVSELQAKFPNATRMEIVMGDLEQPETIRAALVGVDNLLIIPPEKLERFSVIDEAMKAAYDEGVNHTILLSVTKALDATALGKKFAAWERVLEMHSHSWTIIRSSLFHDLMFHFTEQVRRPDHRVHHWLGSGRFCPVDSRDVGQACASVLREGPFEHNGHAYALYGPQPLNFSEMCQVLSKVLGYRVEAIPDITMDQVRSTMEGKLPSFNVEEVVQAHESVANGNDIVVTPDLIKLTGFARTIQAFFEDYKSRFEGVSTDYVQPQSMLDTYANQGTQMMTMTTTTITQQPTVTPSVPYDEQRQANVISEEKVELSQPPPAMKEYDSSMMTSQQQIPQEPGQQQQMMTSEPQQMMTSSMQEPVQQQQGYETKQMMADQSQSQMGMGDKVTVETTVSTPGGEPAQVQTNVAQT